MRRPHQQNIDTDAASLTLGDGIWVRVCVNERSLISFVDGSL